MASNAALAAIERAMIVIRRRQNRRSLDELADLASCDRHDLSLIPALEVVEELDGKATVGTVAALLGLDPSRASRVVASAIEAGHVERAASQADGRVSLLELTDKGRSFISYAHTYRQRLIDEAMTDWSQRDRDQLAALMTRFADGLDKGLPGDA